MDGMATIMGRKHHAAIAFCALLAGCGGFGGTSIAPQANHTIAPLSSIIQSEPAGSRFQTAYPGKVGLGPMVFSKFGGPIFGWDIDQVGDDGLLTETVDEKADFLNAAETFDETTGKITKVVKKLVTSGAGPDFFTDAIAGNDVGLIDGQKYFVRNSRIIRDDDYYAMNPVSGNEITGSWRPTHTEYYMPSYVTNNQASSSQIVMMYKEDLKQGYDAPLLYPYDSATNTWGQPYAFPRKQVLAGYALYAAVYPKTDVAVVGYSPAPFNQNNPLWFDEFDARSGKLLKSLKGHGIGWANGMAIDPTTGIMCTTSEDMGVAFTDVTTGKGFEVPIPIKHFNGGYLDNGAAVAADDIHHLFLVAQLNSTFSPDGGSTVIVYDEKGHLVEAINGFDFLNANSPVVVHIAVNPAKRIGFVPAEAMSQLQSFTY
jgi:hypothetical protein